MPPRVLFLLQLMMTQLIMSDPITCKKFAFCFFGCPLCFGPFVSLIPKLFFFISVLRTIALAQCLWAFGLDVKTITIGLELN